MAKTNYNTVVRFTDNSSLSSPTLPMLMKTEHNSSLQRRVYLIIGVLLLILIVLPNIFSISNGHEGFVYHLLFIFHATFLIFFFISTAIYRNIGDGITTITSLVLFAIYKTIHYLIRYRHCRINSRADFLITTIQLTIVLIFAVTYILWTYLLIRNKYRKNHTRKVKNIQVQHQRIFYSLLSLNLMLTISSVILNIRSQENFGLHQILILSIGIPLALLYWTIGVLMSIYQNCLCTTSFYFLSLIQPFHIIYLIFQSLNHLNILSTDAERNEFIPLFIIIFVCVCTNFLVHLLTNIAACWMISKTDKPIIDMSAAVEDHYETLNYDELEALVSNEAEINRESESTIQTSEKEPLPSSSSCVTQVQKMNLSLAKSSANTEDSHHQTTESVLNVKTSNIPGPVGLLPILNTNEELRRLKENKNARETMVTNQENINVKRPKTSFDLFSLNIDNYPSYPIALRQLRELFSCEPISIGTALVKVRLGIKKRIPLMCAAVTHYDRHENTILLDKSAHIRATFIGDDEVLDNFNIRVGHTLVLRNVAVFTSTRHRHHYVNIHIQNIIAIQDPLTDAFSMPSINEERTSNLIEKEIFAYEDASNNHNETFRIFSQSDHEDDDQPASKKLNNNNSGFNQIKSKNNSTSTKKFQETIPTKSSVRTVTITPPSSNMETDLPKPTEDDLGSEELTNEFFTVW